MIGRTDGYVVDCNPAGEGCLAPYKGTERAIFWEVLNEANMIPGGWSGAIPSYGNGMGPQSPLPNLYWFPTFVPSSTMGNPSIQGAIANGFGSNAFLLVAPTPPCGILSCGGVTFSEGLYPQDAYALDSKIDDGLPLTGNVLAVSAGNYAQSDPSSNARTYPCVTSTSANTYSSPSTGTPACISAFKMSQ